MRERKPRGYWKDPTNVQRELARYTKNGDIPTHSQLHKEGNASLSAAIVLHYGGFVALRRKFGAKVLQEAPGTWKNFEKVRTELERIIKETGEFPTQPKLYKLEKGNLMAAIATHHGGLTKVRETMGYKADMNPPNTWTYERTLDACKSISLVNGELPNQKELQKITGEYRGIARAIAKHGGMAKMRKAMGQDVAWRRNFWTEEKILSEVRTLVKKFKYLPSQTEMESVGRSDLVAAITKYMTHTELVNKLKLPPSMARNNRLEEELIVEECRKIAQVHGNIPSCEKLKALGYGNLATTLYLRGGIRYFRKKLGLQNLMTEHGYWRDWKNIEAALRPIVETLGRFPRTREMNALGSSNLSGVIVKYHGGIDACRERFYSGVAPAENALEQMLEGYIAKSAVPK